MTDPAPGGLGSGHVGTRPAAEPLLAATAELVAIPSPSHREAALADVLEARLRSSGQLEVTRVADNVVARTLLGRPQRVVLAGHLDTVPSSGNDRPRLHGDTLWGLGSADMKGGLAVMLAVADEVGSAVLDPAVDVTWLFYTAEEVARVHNGLLTLAEARPDLVAGDVAVLGEPTSARIEAGCQGTLRLQVRLHGRRAHTARPWRGVNAVHRLAPVLSVVASYEGRQPELEGCRYREALQAVAVEGGVAGNVVPDEASVTLNHRFAPDRDQEAALDAVRAALEPAIEAEAGDTIELLDAAPSAPPSLSDPLVARLLAASGAPPRAKLGWTDVAFFAGRGVPAVNFGPGDPELAHTPDERVGGEELRRAFTALRRLVSA